MSATALSQSYAKLPARDVERARAFYVDKLNLSPFGEYDSHLFYELGGSHFMVYPSSGAASGTHDQIGFVVEDVESMVATLRSNGVIFEEYEPPLGRSEEHTSELQSRQYLVCRLLLEKKKTPFLCNPHI